MTLRDDVRGYFEREARRMPAPASLGADFRESRTAAASERNTPAVRWAAVVAAMLAIAIIAGLVAVGALRHALNPPVPGTRSGQHGNLLDANLIDVDHGWALLSDCQHNKPLQADSALTQQCRFWVESTVDGGRTWANAVQVGGSYQGFPETSWGDTFRHIYFVNQLDGFVYGLGYEYATHDGGRTWEQLNFGTGELLTITGSREIYAVMDSYFLISTDYGRSWMPFNLPASFRPTGGLSFSPGEMLLSSAGAGDMLFVTDGASGRVVRGNCAADSLANSVATTDGAEIWQYCSGETPLSGVPASASAESVYVSSDYGVTWTRHSVGAGITTGPLLVSSQAGEALLVTSTEAAITSGLYLSANRGATWQRVAGATGFVGVAFWAPGDGWAVDGAGRIWATSDGGRSWTKLPSQPV